MRKVVVVVLLLLAVFTFINAYTGNDQVAGPKTATMKTAPGALQ